MIEYRDRRVAELGERLIVASVQDSIDSGRVVEETGPRASRNRLQTVTLLDAIAEHGFDAAFGGARRDEERARAKERMFSFRDDFGQWDPKNQRPELWNLYNGRIHKGEHVRVFPLSNWTELDVWEYIDQEQLEVPSIYFAHEREVFKRDGMLYAWREGTELIDGEEVFTETVRYRTVGDMSCTGGVRSKAATLEEVVLEIAATTDHRARRDASRRPRVRGRDGGPQEGRLLLDDARPAALHHRRLGGRRQEHADRAPAVRLKAGVRGSAGARGAGERAPRRRGTLDLALLTDGLRAEREQGITIDVAYRYFATAKRRFIIADCPGHRQYTRNMVTGASTADVSVVLIDARRGVLEQSKRHAFISALLGIPQMVVAINKMDLVDYSQERYEELVEEFEGFARKLRGGKNPRQIDTSYIPMSALNGDNVVERSEQMAWYDGPVLLDLLEQVEVAYDHPNDRPARFPVQWVIRPANGAEELHDYRGYAGQLASGALRRGDEITVLPGGERTRIAAIDTYDGELEEAMAPMSLTLRLEDELDVSRGELICHPTQAPSVARELEADVCWMHDEPLRPGARYPLKQTSRSATAVIDAIDDLVDVHTLERVAAPQELGLNDIGRVRLRTSAPLVFDPYTSNRRTGSFILIDETTNGTVGAGMIAASKHGEASSASESAALEGVDR